MCDQLKAGFGFASYWLRKWRESGNQSDSAVTQNQSEREVIFDRQFKTGLNTDSQLLLRNVQGISCVTQSDK